MSADPVLSASDVPAPSTKPKHRRRALPRAMRIALSLSRRAVAFSLFVMFVLLGGAFAAGLVVGSSMREEPRVVEKIVERPATAMAPSVPITPSTPNVPSAPIAAKEPEPPPAPKLNVVFGPPDDLSAWGIQIGAYPDLPTAEASVDARASELAAHPIFIVPAEIKGKGVWHRVRIGTFKTRADAEKARAALPEELAKQAMVVGYK